MGRLTEDYLRILRQKSLRRKASPCFNLDYRIEQLKKFKEELIQIFGCDPTPSEVKLSDYLGIRLLLDNACFFFKDSNGEFSIRAAFCLEGELRRNIRFNLDCACIKWQLRFGSLVKPNLIQRPSLKIAYLFSEDKKTSGFPHLQSFPKTQDIPEQEKELIHKEMDLVEAKAFVPLILCDNLLGFLSLGEPFRVPLEPPDDAEEEFSDGELVDLGLYATELIKLLMRQALYL